MSIAFDASSSGDTGSSTSLTFSHTCTGTQRALFVSVIGATTPGNISSVTYGSVAMTQIDSVEGNGSRYIYLFYLKNPASGANNVVITPTSASFMSAVSASYTGVSQTTTPDNHTTNSNNGTSPITTSITTVADNCWTIMAIHCEGGTATASTGSTLRVKDGTFNSPAIFDSNGVVHPAGSTSMTVTTTGSGNAVCMASFSPGTIYSISIPSGTYSVTGNSQTQANNYPHFGPVKGGQTTLTSGSGSITITGNPRRIIVALAQTGVGAGPSPTFITATFNGQSVVFGNVTPSYNSFINQYAPSIGYYIVPDALAAGVYTITTTGTSGTGTSFTEFYDVDPASPFDVTAGGGTTGQSSPFTTSISGNTKYSTYVKTFNGSGGVTYGDGAGETNIWGSTSIPEGSYKMSPNSGTSMSTSWSGGGSQTVMMQVTEMRWGGLFTLAFPTGTYTYTGNSIGLQIIGLTYNLAFPSGTYTYTGNAIGMTYKKKPWTNQAKNTSSYSTSTKNVSSFSNQSKNASSFTNQSKNTSSFSTQSKSSSIWTDQVKS